MCITRFLLVVVIKAVPQKNKTKRLMTHGAYWRKWSKQRIQTNKGHLTGDGSIRIEYHCGLREQKVFNMNAIEEYEIPRRYQEYILRLAEK